MSRYCGVWSLFLRTPPSADAALTWNAARFLTRTVHGTAYAVWSLPTTDSTIELSADCFGSRGNERQHIKSDTSAPEYCATGGDTEGYVGALDYRQTLSGHWQVMAGARVSVVDMKNNGAYAGGEGESSIFGHLEDNEALYAEARARYGVISATAGLRAERTGVRSTFSGGGRQSCCRTASGPR